jgi:hypothetical protein
MAETKIPADYRFFKSQGCRVGFAARDALDLARAERWLKEQHDLVVEYWPDCDADLSWMTDAERQQPHEIIGVVLVRLVTRDGAIQHREHLDSTWGVVDPNDAHLRVLAAELVFDFMMER